MLNVLLGDNIHHRSVTSGLKTSCAPEKACVGFHTKLIQDGSEKESKM